MPQKNNQLQPGKERPKTTTPQKIVDPMTLQIEALSATIALPEAVERLEIVLDRNADYLQAIALYYVRKGEKENLFKPDDLEILSPASVLPEREDEDE